MPGNLSKSGLPAEVVRRQAELDSALEQRRRDRIVVWIIVTVVSVITLLVVYRLRAA